MKFGMHRLQKLTWRTAGCTPLHYLTVHKYNVNQKSRSQGPKEQKFDYPWYNQLKTIKKVDFASSFPMFCRFKRADLMYVYHYILAFGTRLFAQPAQHFKCTLKWIFKFTSQTSSNQGKTRLRASGRPLQINHKYKLQTDSSTSTKSLAAAESACLATCHLFLEVIPINSSRELMIRLTLTFCNSMLVSMFVSMLKTMPVYSNRRISDICHRAEMAKKVTTLA